MQGRNSSQPFDAKKRKNSGCWVFLRGGQRVSGGKNPVKSVTQVIFFLFEYSEYVSLKKDLQRFPVSVSDECLNTA